MFQMSTKLSQQSLIHFLLLAGLGLATSNLAAGGQTSGKTFKCWKNDLGIRECGNMVPPEYSQRRIEIVNDRGLVVKVIEPPKTPEELEKEREQERLRKQREKAKKERERQDAILLNAYTTERDLLIARDTNLKAAQGQIDIAENNLKMLQNTLSDLQTRAGNYERSGNKPPKKLIEDINQTKKSITEKKRTIDKKKSNKAKMEERFKNDLARFRKLKGIKPASDKTPASTTAVPNEPAAKP
jgi:hypothetical protein